MRRLAPLPVALLLLLAGPAAAQPRCPPGQLPVVLSQGRGTPMAEPGVIVRHRCMTSRQIRRLRPGYGCQRPDRRGVVRCTALVPQSPHDGPPPSAPRGAER
ncbi:MAG: hypothetical protein R3A48_10275 [Polyangiales bacterium]